MSNVHNPDADTVDGQHASEIGVEDHSELTGVGTDNHHTRPAPGTGLSEDANGNFDVTRGWTFDGSKSVTGVGSGTYTTYSLSGTYDEVRAVVEFTNNGSTGEQAQLRVNGVTSADYDSRYNNGNNDTGASYWFAAKLPPNVTRTIRWGFEGRFSGTDATAWMVNRGRYSGDMPGGDLNRSAVSSPLSSFAISLPNSYDATIKVWGRDD